MSSERRCESCGKPGPLESDRPLCSQCYLRGALNLPAPQPAPQGEREMLEELAEVLYGLLTVRGPINPDKHASRCRTQSDPHGRCSCIYGQARDTYAKYERMFPLDRLAAPGAQEGGADGK